MIIYGKRKKAWAISSFLNAEQQDEYRKLQWRLEEFQKIIKTAIRKDFSDKENLPNAEVTSIEFGSIEVTATVKGYVEVERPPVVNHIEPSILNQLLNSKLLSDAEKRQLLQSQGILPSNETKEPSE